MLHCQAAEGEGCNVRAHATTGSSVHNGMHGTLVDVQQIGGYAVGEVLIVCICAVLQTRMMMTSLLPSALHCQLLPVPQQQQLTSAAPAAWQGMPAQCLSAQGVQQQKQEQHEVT